MTHIKNKIGRAETIEIAILNNNSINFKFSDNESSLQNIIVEGIIIHSAANLVVSKLNRTLLPDANLKKALITLSTTKQVAVLKEFPIETFIRNDNAVTWLKPFKMDVAKSLVTIPDAAALVIPAGPPQGYAIMVTLFYRPYDPLKDKLDDDHCVIEN